jgi:hypothetical protein
MMPIAGERVIDQERRRGPQCRKELFELDRSRRRRVGATVEDIAAFLSRDRSAPAADVCSLPDKVPSELSKFLSHIERTACDLVRFLSDILVLGHIKNVSNHDFVLDLIPEHEMPVERVLPRVMTDESSGNSVAISFTARSASLAS